jgi:hypothetical protein
MASQTTILSSTVNNTTTKVNLTSLKQRTRKLNNETITQFQDLLENKCGNLFSKTGHKL